MRQPSMTNVTRIIRGIFSEEDEPRHGIIAMTRCLPLHQHYLSERKTSTIKINCHVIGSSDLPTDGENWWFRQLIPRNKDLTYLSIFSEKGNPIVLKLLLIVVVSNFTTNCRNRTRSALKMKSKNKESGVLEVHTSQNIVHIIVHIAIILVWRQWQDWNMN